MNIIFTNAVSAIEPVTSTEVKNYLKLDFTTDDTLITMLITAARMVAEKFCNRSFIEKSIEFSTTDFEYPVILPFPTHGAITEVKLDDVVTEEYETTGLTQFVIELTSPGIAKELKVKYTAGLSLGTGLGSCTPDEKLAILKVVADMYRNRDESGALSENAISYLSPYRVYQ